MAKRRDVVDCPKPMCLDTSDARIERPWDNAESTAEARSTLWLLPVSIAMFTLPGSVSSYMDITVHFRIM